MTLFLGVDMGGTATRWVAADAAGTVVARGQTTGATGLLFDDAARAAFRAALAPIAGQIGSNPLEAAFLGITGAGMQGDAAVTAAAAEALGLPPGRIRQVNDMVLAWHAAFPRGGGHLVSAGTGSVGLSVAADGRITLVGGRGTLIDDAGSGAWIGLRALDAVYRLIDAHGAPRGAEILATHLFDAMGGSDWDSTRRFVYGRDRGAIGTLARAVAAAAQAGDETALTLLTRAGGELARLARVLLDRCGPAPVAVIGGVLGLHPAVRDGLARALPDVTPAFPTIDAAAHAARMARAAAPDRSPP